MTKLISYCCNDQSWIIRAIKMGIIGGVPSFLLKEDGEYLLLESGDKIVL